MGEDTRICAPQPIILRSFVSLGDVGHVALDFPARLTTDDLDDIKAWLAVVVRQMERRAAPLPPPPATQGPADGR